jgi:transcription antitermination factor NusG
LRKNDCVLRASPIKLFANSELDIGRNSGTEMGQKTNPESEVRLDNQWFALLTTSHHEQSVVARLAVLGIESFTPTFDSERVWKNRQRKTIRLPLFPNYVFARIDGRDSGTVLTLPSVHRILGTRNTPTPLSEQEIRFLQADHGGEQVKPFSGLVAGQRVRILSGLLKGLEGVLVRQENGLLFVVSITLINQFAAVRISGEALYPLRSPI